ncbi:MAG: aldehyde dehydrogenase family protein [Byssovorax sp.]
MTQKAGQKCTAIRRIFAPKDVVDQVRDDLVDRLKEHKVGDPSLEGVTVGPLATAAQLRDIRAGIDRLASSRPRCSAATAPSRRRACPRARATSSAHPLRQRLARHGARGPPPRGLRPAPPCCRSTALPRMRSPRSRRARAASSPRSTATIAPSRAR